VRAQLGHTATELSHVTPAVLEPALHTVFVVSAAIALTLLVIGAFMPRRIVEQDPVEEPATMES
jgi:hypothetical protein